MPACVHTSKPDVVGIPCSQCAGIRCRRSIPSGLASYAHILDEDASRRAKTNKKPPWTPPAGYVTSADAARMLGYEQMYAGRDRDLESVPGRYGGTRLYSIKSIEARLASEKKENS